MDAERHAQISALFMEACELPPEERAAFLEKSCAEDSTLRAEVESLLAHHEKAPGLLEPTALHEQVQAMLEALPASDRDERHPDTIGSYKILHLLGEGGQGLVYAARQESPRRTVALKVLKGGAFARSRDVHHFQREIQALAVLLHPGIATIFEAGNTDEGQHFLAMELVDGVPIDAYVRREQLELRDRLELFCSVCDAAHYAHQQGVIHRDLKPMNILVEAGGRPKILDFGLVRITNADSTCVSSDLQDGSVMGSLRYMSPEQACGKIQELDARTDVYSLGVVLYELMTGQRPYDISDSLPDAVLTICRTAPRRPSSADRALHRELETIVLKALEKESARRYRSVEELASDIRRYLAGDPIMASPPSVAYILYKRARKHPVGTTFCFAVILLSLIGLISALRFNQRRLFEARRDACFLQHRLEIADAERFIGEAQSLSDANPRLVDARLVWAQANFRAGRQLDNPALESEALLILKHGLELEPSHWALRLLLAEMYRMADQPEAFQFEEQAEREAPDTADAWYLRSLATMDLHKATDCVRRAVERDPGCFIAVARMAHLCEWTGDYNCALQAAQEMIELGGNFRWTTFQGNVLMRQGRYDAAIRKYAALEFIDPKRWEEDDFFSRQALAYLCLGDYVRAAEAYTKAVEKFPEQATWPLYWRATPLWALGRLDEAIADYRRSIRMRGQAGYANARLFLLYHDKARLLVQQWNTTAAQEILEQASDDLRIARAGVESGSWLAKIFECLAGERSPEALVGALDHSDLERLCGAYYYAAEACLLNGNIDAAMKWFRKCVDTGLVFDPDHYSVDPMSEYHLALWRLEQLGAAEGD